MSRAADIPRVHHLDPDQFRKEYLRKNLPVIVTGNPALRQACARWSFDHLASRHPGHEVAVDAFPDARYAPPENRNPPLEQVRMSYREYVRLIRQAEHRKNFYLAEQPFAEFPDDVTADAPPPPFIGRRKTHPVVFMGIDTYSHAHYHPVRNEAVLMQMHGRKKLILIPARDYRRWYPNGWLSWNMNWSGIPMNADPQAVMGGADAYRAWVAEGNRHGDHPLAATLEPLECTLEPGEVMFIPQGWFHTVYGIGESISVTHFFKGSWRHAHVPLAFRDGVAWLLGTKYRT
jgi:hypothetical protein